MSTAVNSQQIFHFWSFYRNIFGDDEIVVIFLQIWLKIYILNFIFSDIMEISGQNEISKYDMETDISKLEAPTFTTIDRSNAPMLSLDWDHQVNLVGKKVVNPMIHSCDKCLKPILIYGRMIPCKHVFCLGCAKQEERSCPRCGDKVVRVEQAGLGNIFLCTSGGSRSHLSSVCWQL